MSDELTMHPFESAMVRTLEAEIARLRAEVERKDAALREAETYITDDAVWQEGPVNNVTMNLVDTIRAALSAWPGMHEHDRLVVRDNGEGYDREVIGIILPLPTQENGE